MSSTKPPFIFDPFSEDLLRSPFQKAAEMQKVCVLVEAYLKSHNQTHLLHDAPTNLALARKFLNPIKHFPGLLSDQAYRRLLEENATRLSEVDSGHLTVAEATQRNALTKFILDAHKEARAVMDRNLAALRSILDANLAACNYFLKLLSPTLQSRMKGLESNEISISDQGVDAFNRLDNLATHASNRGRTVGIRTLTALPPPAAFTTDGGSSLRAETLRVFGGFPEVPPADHVDLGGPTLQLENSITFLTMYTRFRTEFALRDFSERTKATEYVNGAQFFMKPTARIMEFKEDFIIAVRVVYSISEHTATDIYPYISPTNLQQLFLTKVMAVDRFLTVGATTLSDIKRGRAVFDSLESLVEDCFMEIDRHFHHSRLSPSASSTSSLIGVNNVSTKDEDDDDDDNSLPVPVHKTQSTDSPSSTSHEYCYNFLRGHCPHGANCRRIHLPREILQRARDSGSPSNSSRDKNAAAPSNRHSGRGQNHRGGGRGSYGGQHGGRGGGHKPRFRNGKPVNDRTDGTKAQRINDSAAKTFHRKQTDGTTDKSHRTSDQDKAQSGTNRNSQSHSDRPTGAKKVRVNVIRVVDDDIPVHSTAALSKSQQKKRRRRTSGGDVPVNPMHTRGQSAKDPTSAPPSISASTSPRTRTRTGNSAKARAPPDPPSDDLASSTGTVSDDDHATNSSDNDTPLPIDPTVPAGIHTNQGGALDSFDLKFPNYRGLTAIGDSGAGKSIVQTQPSVVPGKLFKGTHLKLIFGNGSTAKVTSAATLPQFGPLLVSHQCTENIASFPQLCDEGHTIIMTAKHCYLLAPGAELPSYNPNELRAMFYRHSDGLYRTPLNSLLKKFLN